MYPLQSFAIYLFISLFKEFKKIKEGCKMVFLENYYINEFPKIAQEPSLVANSSRQFVGLLAWAHTNGKMARP